MCLSYALDARLARVPLGLVILAGNHMQKPTCLFVFAYDQRGNWSRLLKKYGERGIFERWLYRSSARLHGVRTESDVCS